MLYVVGLSAVKNMTKIQVIRVVQMIRNKSKTNYNIITLQYYYILHYIKIYLNGK